MKTYLRTDGFEVQDVSGMKSVEAICSEFGGTVDDWTDVTSARESAALANQTLAEQAREDAERAKASGIAKLKALGLTDLEINALSQ